MHLKALAFATYRGFGCCLHLPLHVKGLFGGVHQFSATRAWLFQSLEDSGMPWSFLVAGGRPWCGYLGTSCSTASKQGISVNEQSRGSWSARRQQLHPSNAACGGSGACLIVRGGCLACSACARSQSWFSRDRPAQVHGAYVPSKTLNPKSQECGPTQVPVTVRPHEEGALGPVTSLCCQPQLCPAQGQNPPGSQALHPKP